MIFFFLVYVAVLFIKMAKVKQHLSLARLAQESIIIFKDEKYFLLCINIFFFQVSLNLEQHTILSLTLFSLYCRMVDIIIYYDLPIY